MNPLTTVPLDADAETLLREHGVMVVDGDYLNCQIHDKHPNLNCQPGPPSWAVAATQPCETCNGCPPWLPYGPGALQTVCLNCHNGRPVLSFIVGDATSFWTVGEVTGNEDGTFTVNCEQVAR